MIYASRVGAPDWTVFMHCARSVLERAAGRRLIVAAGRAVRCVVGYRVLLGEPGAQIDEAAAVAAKRPKCGFRHPFDGALASRAFDDRDHGEGGTGL